MARLCGRGALAAALLAASTAAGRLLDDGAGAGCAAGQCEQPAPLVGDHLLLQFRAGLAKVPASGGQDQGAIELAANLSEGLELVWSDDFDGDRVNTSKWGFATGGGGFGNGELQHYTDRPDNARVDGGTLKIIAKCEQYKSEAFTSAKLITKDTATWAPGHRIEVRAKVPTNRGSWPAIWMLPKDSKYGIWPRSGEIDIMEAVGCNPGRIYGTIHTEAYNHIIHTEKQSVVSTDASEWRVYGINWEDGRITWDLDGVTYHTFAPDERTHPKWPFDQEFFLILNVAVAGSWGGWCLQGHWPSCTDPEQFGKDNIMEVDYARVYKLAGSFAQTWEVTK